jgi:hypothetical protein
MLQHNVLAPRQRAHLAHAAVVGLHALCCGLPVLALVAVSISGATSGVALFSESVSFFHDLLHAYELWIMGVSAMLVGIGAGFEVLARRQTQGLGFPWMFLISVACFFVNVAIIAAHRF